VEKSGHQAQGLAHERGQDVLAGSVLGAASVGVGDPDGGQTQDIGEGIVGEGAAEVGQDGGFFFACFFKPQSYCRPPITPLTL
jgi:hypothetical protein